MKIFNCQLWRVHTQTTHTLFYKTFVTLSVCFIMMKLTTIFALSNYSNIDITISSDSPGYAQLYYTGGNQNLNFSENNSIKRQYKDALNQQTLTFPIGNKFVSNIRIDPGNTPGTYLISNIRLHSHFGPSKIITPATKLDVTFTDDSSTLEVNGNSWELTSKSSDPYLIIGGDLTTENTFFKYLLPLLFSILVFIFLPNQTTASLLKIKEMACFKDVSEKKPSSGVNLDALDGMRGFAAILVLADHTGLPGCDGLGLVGVVIFFCLSGFLLTIPFIRKPTNSRNPEYLRNYFLRRLKRLLPMYILVCFAGFIFQSDLNSFFQSLLFIKASGVHWTIHQEMYFYLLLPLIMAACYFLLRSNLILCSFTLLLTAYLFNNYYLQVNFIKIYGLDSQIPPYVGVFISGMAASFAFHFLKNITDNANALIKTLFGNFIVQILILIIIICSQNLPWMLASHSKFWVFTGNYPLFISTALLLTTLIPKGFLSQLFNLYPLRAIGVVGYSFYLLHPVILINCNNFFKFYTGINLPNPILFVIALIFTYVASAFTYTFIEKPFLRSSKQMI